MTTVIHECKKCLGRFQCIDGQVRRVAPEQGTDVKREGYLCPQCWSPLDRLHVQSAGGEVFDVSTRHIDGLDHHR